jgi:hypothetical protein
VTLQSRLRRLEALQPKMLLIGLTVTTEGRVRGVAPFRDSDAALERWARTGEPTRTVALLFATDAEPCAPMVPVEEMHPEALAVVREALPY